MKKEDVIERTTAATALKGANGHPVPAKVQKYPAKVQSTGRPSRAEVEARLESTSASISSRLGALQQEVTSTGESVKKAVTENAWLGVGAALLGGLAVGFLLTRPGRGKKEAEPQDPDQIATLVTRSVQAALSEGNDPTADVAQLLDRLSRDDKPAAASSSSGLVRSLVLTLANAGIRYALSRAGSAGGSAASESGKSGPDPA